MIDVKELRVRNYITTLLSDKPTQVHTIKTSEVKDGLFCLVNTFIPEHLNPIPLTPDVLMKCGFIDPAKNGWGYRMPISSKDELCWYMQDGFIRLQTQGSGFTRRMDHVTQLHQLQNLFYWVTGDELVVNL